MKTLRQKLLNSMSTIVKIYNTIYKLLLTFILILLISSCGERTVSQAVTPNNLQNQSGGNDISQPLSEVAPPKLIQELTPSLEVYRPQIEILTPQPETILQDNTVSVSFQVKDLPIFQNPELKLGPHLHVILDNQPYIPVYNLNQPLILANLSPGTHTLRAFASRPWHESFKNEGAYAQTTFHIFTKTEDNNPDANLPVLTYSRPQGDYGAEPILLDFYLTNAPLRLAEPDNTNDTISDWRIRCTINGKSFILDSWQSTYLKGFKPGKNWVKLEFLDNQGNPLKNAFNTTARIINYQPAGKDSLAKIIRGELTAQQVKGIVDSQQPETSTTTPINPATPTPQPETQTTTPITPATPT